MSLKRLPRHITDNLLYRDTKKVMLMSDKSPKRLLWRVTENATPTRIWKGYGDDWGVTKKATVMSYRSLKRLPRHMSLQRLLWHVTENATLTSDGSLKRLPQYVTEKATPTRIWKGYGDEWGITEKATVMSDRSLKRLHRHMSLKCLL
jgi:hypothetical protein